jgi:hypothetical protein
MLRLTFDSSQKLPNPPLASKSNKVYQKNAQSVFCNRDNYNHVRAYGHREMIDFLMIHIQ